MLMKKPKHIRLLSLLLAVLFAFGAFSIQISADPGGQHRYKNNTSNSLEEMEKYLRADSYATYIQKQQGVLPGAAPIVFDLSQLPTGDAEAYVIDSAQAWAALVGNTDDYNSDMSYVYLPNEGSATWAFSVPENGMYHIKFVYYTSLIESTVNDIERKLSIDGEIPFAEANYFNWSKIWTYEYPQNDDGTWKFNQDLAGNSLTPPNRQRSAWRSYYCRDSVGFTNEYYQFYFSKGEHTLTLQAQRESTILGAIVLVPTDSAEVTVPTYEEYYRHITETLGATSVSTGKGTVIQAELPLYVSDTSVYMSSNRSSALNQPSAATAQVYNVIGSDSYNSVGQYAAYAFTVEQTGLYDMIMRVQQTTLMGMFVCRAVKLWSSDGMYGLADGTPTVPFQEAYNARFDYNKDWQVVRVGDGEETFSFYFKEGVTYVLYLEVGLGSLAETLSRTSDMLKLINDCYLEILRLTGATPDDSRDYFFSDIMPEVIYNLNYAAVELSDIADYFELISGSTGAHISTLDTIALLLARMGTDEREIAANLASLKTYLGTLGTWFNQSKTSSMTVDWIAFQSHEDKLPKANANIFQSLWYEIRSFVRSFFTDYSVMGVTDRAALSADALEVWLADGRDQSKIWRSLIDSSFTAYCANESVYCRENNITNIATNLKLVAGGTLLPSILAGAGPDAYMGLDSATVINYSIRGAIQSINEFSDHEAYIDANFHDAAINTIELLGEVYGLPMTMNLPMMYYRTDVLVDLGMQVPETWDELLGLLPVLQNNNLEVGLLGIYQMLLYQHGGSMWKYEDDYEYAGSQIGLDSNLALEVFDDYCRLFTDYSFPYQYDAANRFRTGEMPIVIGDYVGIYNTLVVFATEIDGLWEFSSVPGTLDSEGNLNYTALAGVAAVVIPYKKGGNAQAKAAAWEYLKWVTSAEAQSSYGNRMVAIQGPSAKYATANMNAIDLLSWTSSEAKAIYDQMDHLASVKNYPGSYIYARYINFAFLAAYNTGADPVDSLQKYISAINTEISRKREEFGLKTLESGQTPEDMTP